MWWFVTIAAASTLQDAWTAAEKGPELEAAAAGAERSRATVGIARSAVLPKVALNGGYTWNDEEISLDLGASLPPSVLALTGPIDPFVVQQKDWFEASATLMLPIVDADGWATLGAASRAADAADADLEVARRRVRVGVARAFFGALLARDSVTIAEEAVAVATRQAEAAKARVAAGDTPPRTSLEAEQALLAAERDRLAAVERVAVAEEALRRFTGIVPGSPLEATPVNAPGLDVLLATERPEQRAAALREDAAAHAKTAAGLAWAPDVSARLTGLITQNAGFASDDTFVVAHVDASWVWDGGGRSARQREAGAGEWQARAWRLAVDRQVEEEVRVANAGLIRAPSTLSGGETFLVSLALALSLSERIQLAGRTRFDFFFLDEGFGALDAQTLEMALTALERLRGSRRVIGMISHVAAIEEDLDRIVGLIRK